MTEASDLGPRPAPAGAGELIQCLDKAVDKVLSGQIKSVITITDGAEGLQASWAGVEPPGVIGALQISLALLIGQFAGGFRR